MEPGWLAFVSALLAAAVRTGTSVGYAAVGETIAQRAGIMNLGLEGVMLVSAMTAVAVQVATGQLLLACIAAAVAGMLVALVHVVVVEVLHVDQIVSGLALTMLGTGLSGFLGRPFVGARIDGLPTVGTELFPAAATWPAFLKQDVLAYLAPVVALLVWAFLFRTGLGVRLRAVGESPESAYKLGVNVVLIRVGAVAAGGALAGLGGAHLALAYARLWAEKMTAGQGWIAVSLVIVGRWRPIEALAGAYAFGALTALHPRLQAMGVSTSPYLLGTLPYVAAAVAVVVTAAVLRSRGYGVPAALGRSFNARVS